VAIHALVHMAAGPAGVWSKWYLDDGYLAGPLMTLHHVLPDLENEAKLLGLSLNKAKCQLFVAGGTHLDEPRFLPGIPRVPATSCLAILGAPVGPDEACQDWIQSNILDPLQLSLDRLGCLGDPQAAALVLRQCLSSCKVNWTLRTSTPAVSSWTANKVRPMLRQAWNVILGQDPGEAQWELATLPIRLGGAGISDPVLHWPAACLSSWLSASKALGPTVLQPPDGMMEVVSLLGSAIPSLGAPLKACQSLTAVYRNPLMVKWCQQNAWQTAHWEVLAATWDSAVTERLRCLRNLHLAPHAGSWLTALPSVGPDRLSAPEFQLLLRFRTGANLYDPGGTCKCCNSPMDPTGDHALCCSAAGVYRRHNHVRNFLYSISQEVGWSPSLEEMLPGTQTRPADVLLSSLDASPTAVDVTIVHPLRPSGQTIAGSAHPGNAAAQAEATKTTASASPCAERHWLFRPFGMEVTGALGPQATRLMKRACRCLSMRRGGSYGDAAAYLFGGLHLALAKGRGEMLLACAPATS
jgi:hypothetical protein